MKEFELYLLERELSTETIKKYTHDVKFFLLWQNGQGKKLTRETACEWKVFLSSQNHAPSTINAALAAFNHYAMFVGKPECKLKYVKAQKKIFLESEKMLTRREYKQLVKCAKQKANARLAMIIETIGSTGMRVSELAYITVEALITGNIQIQLKGKIRTILLPHKLCSKLRAYAKKQGIEAGAIFITKKGAPISRKQIWCEMKKLCDLAGILESKVFPHNLRHLFARVFYEKNGDLVELADILGHSNVETTRIYLRKNSQIHQKKLEQLHMLC